jgi:hypothetical protein
MTCPICKQGSTLRLPTGKISDRCIDCLLLALAERPNPGCQKCRGRGSYFSMRKIYDCDCSIFDAIEEKHV